MKRHSASSMNKGDRIIYYLTMGTCFLAATLFVIAVITLLNYDDLDSDVNNEFEEHGSNWAVLTIWHNDSDVNSGIIGIKKIQTGGFLETYVSEEDHQNPDASDGSNGNSQTFSPLSQTGETLQDTNSPRDGRSINGKCDESVVNGCGAGSLSDVSDNSSHYRWMCVGLSGGGDDSCSKSMPSSEPVNPVVVNGVCDESVVNGCGAGSLSDVSDSSSHYRWMCVGLSGGGDDSCSKSMPSSEPVNPVVVNGVCDESVVNGCGAGSLSDVSDSSSHYRWMCAGLNGGSDDSCSKSMPSSEPVNPVVVNGVCDESVVNGCGAGSLSDVSDSSSHYRWMCAGLNGGSDDSCYMRKPPNPVAGRCDQSRINGCSSGTLNDTPDDSSYYKWRCMGSKGMSHQSCYKRKPLPAVNGVCDETKYRCIAGSYEYVADTTLQYRWTCKGRHGGSDASCNINVPLDPRIAIERTINQYSNKPQLIMNVTGRHVMFRFTQEVESLDTVCDSSQTPRVSRWSELFGPRTFGLGENKGWITRDFESYKITQKNSSTQYVCVIVVYGNASTSGSDLDYSYYLSPFE